MEPLQLQPPAFALTPALRWLLPAAFSPELPPLPGSGEREALVKLATRLGLAERVWMLHGRTLEALDDGADLARELRRCFNRSTAITLAYEEVAQHVAAVASELSVPLVFLKGFALMLSRDDTAWRRPFSDLDILVSTKDLERLHTTLRQRGFEASAASGNEQHLATLVSPSGGAVDLHFCLRGITLGSRRWATAEELAASDLPVRLKGFPGRCFVPTIGVQTAHLLAHGFTHHFWRPNDYPLLRTVGDLCDLLADEKAWRAFRGEFEPALVQGLTPAMLDAIEALTLDLAAGRIPETGGAGLDPAAMLLRHILAGSLDSDYAHRLRPRHTRDRLLDAARQGQLVHYLRRKLSSSGPRANRK